MGIEVVEITLNRSSNKEAWGFRVVGGVAECLVLKIEKILGIDTAASKAGLKERDVILEVNGKGVVDLSHKEFVTLVRQQSGNTLKMKVERGEIVVPNMQDCFPIKNDQDIEKMTDDEKLQYYEEAMRRGLGGYLNSKLFTTVGKFKVKVPKYNCPQGLYSETTMDEMVGGSGQVDLTKMDPTSPCYTKLAKTKKFDPKRSSVLCVLQDHEKGKFEVDVQNIIEIKQENVRKI